MFIDKIKETFTLSDQLTNDKRSDQEVSRNVNKEKEKLRYLETHL